MLYGEYLSLLNERCQMDDEDEGDVPILAFEEVNIFAVGGDFPRNISKLATLARSYHLPINFPSW